MPRAPFSSFPCPQRIRDLVAPQKIPAVHEDGISLKCCYIWLRYAFVTHPR
jgi:hypothetical protein